MFLPESVSVVFSDTVLILVLLTNRSEKEISSYNFAVLFDSTVMKPEESAIETMNSLSSNGRLIASDTNHRGRIGIAASSLNNSVTNSGMLLYLCFRTVGEIKKSSCTFAQTDLSFETTKKGNKDNIFMYPLGNRIHQL